MPNCSVLSGFCARLIRMIYKVSSLLIIKRYQITKVGEHIR